MSNTSVLKREVLRTTCSELTFDSTNRVLTGFVTITNTSQQAIAGPLRVRLMGLGMGLRLVLPDGGSKSEPHLTACLQEGPLLPGASIEVPIQVKVPFWHLGLVRLTAQASGSHYGLHTGAMPAYQAA